MNLPFTLDEFLEVFRTYNLSVWPAQIVLLIVALTLIILIMKKKSYSDQVITAGLVLLWLWMGLIYHYTFFSKINDAAYLFSALFITQAILLSYFGLYKGVLNYSYKNDSTGLVSTIFFLYALIFYPMLSFNLGHIYPATPTFGLPCPTTIFTFGVLLLLNQFRRVVFIVPLLWSLVGFTAALKFGIYEDIGLLLAGIATAIIVFMKKNTLFVSKGA